MESPWSLSVKTVGNNSATGDFVIKVSPEDELTSLHSQIEEFTGLKASQQRLIYRGRIIRGADDASSSLKNEPKVKDVVGLEDGHTIHLVPRPEAEGEETSGSSTPAREVSDSSNHESSDRTGGSAENEMSSMGGALLAALLGLEPDDEDDNPLSLGRQLQRLRRGRNRRPNHRFTQSDLEVPDPGSMEPVRQGLLTLHTLLGRQQENSRQWYRGQWIDCRDTVNQWLEATIVDIVRPDDVLPPQLQTPSRRATPTRPTTDPAVSASDMEGRMRLLLEPTDGCPHSQDEWGGFRQRDNNYDVQLLLIHYNGWPHRWDEWIRSDSERIRPFRTRTRHLNSANTACPTPQSHFDASPSTSISGDDEAADRAALLPELRRVLSQVNTLIEAVEKDIATGENATEDHDVPWIRRSGQVGAENEEAISVTSCESQVSQMRGITGNRAKAAHKKQLQMLAPLLDRLGRTLTDAAPHVASYAASLPDDPPREPQRTPPGQSNVVVARDVLPEPPQPQRASLFSLLSVSGRRSGASTLPRGNDSDDYPESEDEDEIIEPDYVDFVSGSVNTSRGEVRGRGSRSSTDDASSLLGAYLAAASLSSLLSDDDGGDSGGLPGLVRLLRQRDAGSGSGGGIDIHIHAIVTGPGVATGGLAMLGEQPVAPSPTRPSLFSSSSRRSGIVEPRSPGVVAPVDDEELGIFADLYSENPAPVDLQNGSPPSGVTEHRSSSANSLDNVDSVSGDSLRISADNSRSPWRRNQPLRENSSQSSRGGAIFRVIRRVSRRSLRPDENGSSG